MQLKSCSSHPFVTELIKRFKLLYQGSPRWAWDLCPTIPLVGQRFKPGRGLLVYASAENLNRFKGRLEHERYRSESAWNRYRWRYENAGRLSKNFFPDVGIQPVTDGGLLAAALFVSVQHGLPVTKTPRTFLENIAISNWAKFIIQTTDRNRDYNDLSKLTCSLSFVVTELAVLKPAAVLLPKAFWHHPILATAMRGAAPSTRFMPLPQFNATVVNCHLAKHDAQAKNLQRRYTSCVLGKWMRHLERIREEHAWRFMAAAEKA